MADPSPNQTRQLDFSVQEYLSIGYIYIVVLGIISDVVYYSFLDIDILSYSTILDILISPINTLMSDLKVLGLFTLFIGGMYIIMFNLLPKLQKNKPQPTPKQAENITQKKAGTLAFLAFMVFSMFLGFGLGRGAKTRAKIKNNELEWSHTLLFKTGEFKQVKMLGVNSNYVFYVAEGTQDITIAPISDNVSQISPLPEEE